MPLISKRNYAKRQSRRKEETWKGNDIISQLHDHLIHQILLNLPTKDSVKTSVLSTRWRYLWKHVPGLECSGKDFGDHDLNDFVDRFLAFDHKKSLVRHFSLNFDHDTFFVNKLLMEKWINVVVSRGLQYLDIDDSTSTKWCPIDLPFSICMCQTLVHLKLNYAHLECLDSVSLPRLETMHLGMVWFSNDAVFERLISSPPVLRRLEIKRIQNVEVLRVRSQTLKSLNVSFCNRFENGGKTGLVIDAPKLKDLCLGEDEFETLLLNSVGSSMRMDIDVLFEINDISEIEVLRNFLVRISEVVTDLTISGLTLAGMYKYSRHAPLPQFPNLTRLCASFRFGISNFLATCPNLKSLYLDSGEPDIEETTRSPVPQCMLTSLEFVELKIPIDYNEGEVELVGYILGNAAVLKKLVLHLDSFTAKHNCLLLKQLLSFSRRSSACQVFIP